MEQEMGLDLIASISAVVLLVSWLLLYISTQFDPPPRSVTVGLRRVFWASVVITCISILLGWKP